MDGSGGLIVDFAKVSMANRSVSIDRRSKRLFGLVTIASYFYWRCGDGRWCVFDGGRTDSGNEGWSGVGWRRSLGEASRLEVGISV